MLISNTIYYVFDVYDYVIKYSIACIFFPINLNSVKQNKNNQLALLVGSKLTPFNIKATLKARTNWKNWISKSYTYYMFTSISKVFVIMQ